MTDRVVVSIPEPAPKTCLICGKRLPASKAGLQEVSLLFDATGQPKGWGCAHHVPDLSRHIREEIEQAMCARCGLPLAGEHTISSDGCWCRDGSDFELVGSPVSPSVSVRPHQDAAD